MSLWVVLMVPVSAFAAVVAMAGPQRLAAQSSVQDAADDLAAFTVAARDGQDVSGGPLSAFPPECSREGLWTRFDDEIERLQARIDDLETQIESLAPGDELIAELRKAQQADRGEVAAQRRKRTERLTDWENACTLLFDALLRDLGYLGVDMGSVRGFYSDSLTTSGRWSGTCTDSTGAVTGNTTESSCTGSGWTWTPTPCRTARDKVVRDAAHVALAGDWQDAGWAAAQVWPDGLPMAAESIGRLSRYDERSAPNDCDRRLVAFDEQGRPVWASDPHSPSRSLAQSVRRTALLG